MMQFIEHGTVTVTIDGVLFTDKQDGTPPSGPRLHVTVAHDIIDPTELDSILEILNLRLHHGIEKKLAEGGDPE